jgi:hypothetical protein
MEQLLFALDYRLYRGGVILNSLLMLGQALLAIKIVIFLWLTLIYRPKELANYSWSNRMKLALNPLPAGRGVIQPADWGKLKWYRWGWLTILALLMIRLILALGMHYLALNYPDVLIRP